MIRCSEIKTHLLRSSPKDDMPDWVVNRMNYKKLKANYEASRQSKSPAMSTSVTVLQTQVRSLQNKVRELRDAEIRTKETLI